MRTRNRLRRPANPMIDLLQRDWKPLLLCLLLAVLIWFLVGERSGQTEAPPLLTPTGNLVPPEPREVR